MWCEEKVTKPTADPDMEVYRFVSFFELYSLIKEGQLRLTSLHKMDDKNEGVGKILRSLELSPIVHRDRQEQKITQHMTYITCWTTTPDNIAMWTLYSLNQENIRIKTTVSKLYSAIKKINYAIHSSMNYSPSYQDVFCLEYKNLRQCKEDIEIKLQRLKDKPQPSHYAGKAEKIRTLSKSRRRYLQEDSILDNDTWKYKDENYTFENEVRGQIEFSATDEDSHDYCHSSLCDFSEFSDFIYAPIFENFIDEICFDPRCPKYKTKIFTEIINPNKNIHVVESHAFGTIL